MEEIREFQGEYRWLSNFWPAPIMYNKILYPSAEHAYQASKTDNVMDKQHICTLTAGQAKRYARTLRLIDNWENIKVNVMREIVLLKFIMNKDLRDKLLATGDATLIEGNTWGDTFWGVCKGRGNNMLGNILMDVRGILHVGEHDESDGGEEEWCSKK